MVASRSLVWSVFAAWFALFAAAVQVSATLEKPVMWILVHKALKQARIDPIVNPGKLSSHVHSLVGANGVDANTTTAELVQDASTCTTSGLPIDMSAYWAPSLYSYNADKDTLTPRPLGYVNTYYLMRGNVPITAFPRGLQMLAGSATRDASGPTKQNDNTVSFVCLNYKDGSSQTALMPKGPCPHGLRTQVVFPSCWNGKDLISSDHSHVVYPLGDNADNGDCPTSHNIRLPTLFYEFVWGVDGQDNRGNSTWVFGNGDAIGYSFHADFLAAWDEQVLQEAIDQCEGNLFNNLEACPPLAKHLDRQASQECTAESSEATKGSLESLPGCNVIWNGPNAGKGLKKGCDPNKVMMRPENWAALSNGSSASVNASSIAPSSCPTATRAVAATTTTTKAAAASSASPQPVSTSHVNNGNNGSNNKPGNNVQPVAGIKKSQPKPQPIPKPSKKPTKKPTNRFGTSSSSSNAKKQQQERKKKLHQKSRNHHDKSTSKHDK
ncbi:uncharacterized protein UHOD_12166 [Ustilago sp. UG-2017b]|nr:uncharacterized protein UHOD_12166 [Ustilago sp. UG-2017b]